MRTMGTAVLLLTSILTLHGCGAGEEGGSADGAAEDAAAPPPASPSPAGVVDGARATVAIAEMRAHLNVLTAAGGDEMVAMVPQHRERVESLITQLGGVASASPAWGPTADSVRQDLSRMQGLPANELEVLVEANAERLSRLIGIYEAAAGPR
jgi:hypothetical protein